MDLIVNREQIIYTHNLTKSFDGTVAVKNLNLDIPSGSIFGFIGPSGCGKTTTVRLLLGIYTSDSGDIEVLNTNPQNFGRKEREQIGYMPQQFVLYPDLTVWENLNFVASIYGVPIRRHKQLQTVLDLVELTGHEKKKALNLSGGMQRRLTLASSLIHNPRLIFLDEPTAGIDPVLRRKFWDYFQTLKEKGHTLFVTTQYVGEAVYCDYVGVMADGRLLVVDTPAGLRRRALGREIIHLYTQQMMSESQVNQLREQPFILENEVNRLHGKGLEISVNKADSALPLLMEWCRDQNISVDSASEFVPNFDDIFVKLIEQETASLIKREIQ